MRIVVLATEGDTTRMLVGAIRREYADLIVGFEHPVSRYQLLKRRAVKLGWWTVFGQMLFMLFLAVWRKTTPSLDAAFSLRTSNADGCYANCTSQKFYSVNSDSCIAWLNEQQPDVVVLNGTRIVSDAVLNSCGATFLNIHCGITPRYRGVHGGYWALYQREPHNAGVTVHLVDTGIDTGDIIYQANIEVDSGDNFLTYPIKQYLAGIPLVIRALDDIENGRLRTHKRADLESAIWSHPTLWQYLWARCTRGVK